MPNPTKETLLEIAEAHARAIMIGGKKQLTPVAHLIKSNGEDLILGTPWRDDFEKVLTQKMLSALMRAGDVVRYALVCEAWTRKATDDELAGLKPGELPSVDPIAEHPDRKEIVFAIAVDRDGHLGRVWDTKRDANGHCVDLVLDSDAEDHVGAFLDLLPRDA